MLHDSSFLTGCTSHCVIPPACHSLHLLQAEDAPVLWPHAIFSSAPGVSVAQLLYTSHSLRIGIYVADSLAISSSVWGAHPQRSLPAILLQVIPFLCPYPVYASKTLVSRCGRLHLPFSSEISMQIEIFWLLVYPGNCKQCMSRVDILVEWMIFKSFILSFQTVTWYIFCSQYVYFTQVAG